jgi:hypothetical protein
VKLYLTLLWSTSFYSLSLTLVFILEGFKELFILSSVSVSVTLNRDLYRSDWLLLVLCSCDCLGDETYEFLDFLGLDLSLRATLVLYVSKAAIIL